MRILLDTGVSSAKKIQILIAPTQIMDIIKRRQFLYFWSNLKNLLILCFYTTSEMS